MVTWCPWMVRVRKELVFSALIVVMETGCIPALSNRAEGPAITPARVVVMPPVGLVSTLDADGVESQVWPTDRTKSNIGDYLRTIAQENGARMADSSTLRACGSACAQFTRWGTIASLQIGVQRAKIRNYGRHSVAEWTFPGDLSPIRSTFDADYSLLIMFKQVRQTTARKVWNALSNSWIVGAQITVACVVDLRDGSMTWCATKHDDSHDVAEAGPARAELSELLGGVFRVPPAPTNSGPPGKPEIVDPDLPHDKPESVDPDSK